MYKIYNKTTDKILKETLFLSETNVDQATLHYQSDDIIQVIDENGRVIFPC